MDRLFNILILFAISITISAQSSEQLLLSGWRFHRGSAEGAQAANYDDSKWQQVTIPHDWAISGPFDKEIDKQVVAISENGETLATEKTGRSGSLPWIGEGWYRTQIVIPDGYAHGELIFDGAMSEPHVWVDGKDIGYWAYGYSTFSLSLSPAIGEGNKLRPGSYTLAVHLQNKEESSRWYPGAGLYRPVRLMLHKEMYIKPWETFVRTTKLAGFNASHTRASEAKLTITTQVNERRGKPSVRLSLMDGEGHVVANSQRELLNGFTSTTQVLNLVNVKLWSPEAPELYTLITEVVEGDRVWDRQETSVGIRLAEYTSEGFFLNGKKRKFHGVCLHHDMGPVGAAFLKDAFRRQVRLLKEMGCDAIRTAHNMPAPWQMDICDEMGMLVMAESFDMWKSPKCRNGYARFFDKVDTQSVNQSHQPWYIRDITNLVKVHRNHPSIVMWSIGNEVPEQGRSDGLYFTKSMQQLIHELDGTRPVTQGMNHGDAAMNNGVWQVMDIPGWNYHIHRYRVGIEQSSKGIIVASETASTVSSRGVYKFPVEELVQQSFPDGQVSSYDIEMCAWSNLPDDDWMLQDKMPGVIGEFVWTGFDYLGEPTPYDEYWPSRSSYFGIYDLAGLPKDRMYLYRSHWAPERETLHLLPHWTWPDRNGEVTPVFCYTNYPEAELFVNGKSQGRRKHIDVDLEDYLNGAIIKKVLWGHERFANPEQQPNRLDRYRMRWNDVVYEPGELRVVAYDAQGNAVAEKRVKTAGSPHHIELKADRTSMPVTPTDSIGRPTDCPSLIFVTARIVDKDGNLCPNADTQLHFEVKGNSARFHSACNGDATSIETFTQPTMRAFHGELVIVVESTQKRGNAVLKVTGTGVKSTTQYLEIR
ncbi:MAG: DUF4982 domain-containing protein [Bacteroidales bacterium]|nr:DUF4982 domain-containing protein [Candidatus Physcousia equi]